MIQRFLLDRIDTKSAASAIGRQHHPIANSLTHKARSTSDPDSQIVSTQRPFEQYRSGNQSLHTARAPADSLTTDQQSESPDRLLKNKLSLSAPSSALTPPRLQKPR